MKRRSAYAIFVAGLAALAAVMLCGCGTPNADVSAPYGDGIPPDPCGDGIVDRDEECDDGDGNSDSEPNACRTDCTNPGCGDGVLDSGEDCDDGNTVGGDGCGPGCLFEVCGNDYVDLATGEECDRVGDPFCVSCYRTELSVAVPQGRTGPIRLFRAEPRTAAMLVYAPDGDDESSGSITVHRLSSRGQIGNATITGVMEGAWQATPSTNGGVAVAYREAKGFMRTWYQVWRRGRLDVRKPLGVPVERASMCSASDGTLGFAYINAGRFLRFVSCGPGEDDRCLTIEAVPDNRPDAVLDCAVAANDGLRAILWRRADDPDSLKVSALTPEGDDAWHATINPGGRWAHVGLTSDSARAAVFTATEPDNENQQDAEFYVHRFVDYGVALPTEYVGRGSRPGTEELESLGGSTWGSLNHLGQTIRVVRQVETPLGPQVVAETFGFDFTQVQLKRIDAPNSQEDLPLAIIPNIHLGNGALFWWARARSASHVHVYIKAYDGAGLVALPAR